MDENIFIKHLSVKDIRFPTSQQQDGSDAMHTNPDYSCAYVTIETNTNQKGYGMTFTLGKGTEVVVCSIIALKDLVIGKKTKYIYENFGHFWRLLTSDSQLRWVGPEKGVIHLATAAIMNALWDLWARLEGKPVWKLLVDLTPEQLVSTIDFRYITDVITKEEAIEILKRKADGKSKREKELLENGYPCYTTQVGWLGYSSEKVKTLCKKYLAEGFTAFKIKVGQNLEDDKKRCAMVRENIGESNTLMLDANQVWDVNEALDWMENLAVYRPLWIEEPTSPDDILGHAKIAKALKKFNIGVATGEMCCNRVIFKQLLQINAVEYCQIDSARIGGINEILSVYLMAEKLNVKVCPHAGGIGLCEMVQHLQFWDYISLSGTTEGRYIEYVDQQHEHFKVPVVIRSASYIPPMEPGYSCEMIPSSIEKYEFPTGEVWKNKIQVT